MSTIPVSADILNPRALYWAAICLLAVWAGANAIHVRDRATSQGLLHRIGLLVLLLDVALAGTAMFVELKLATLSPIQAQALLAERDAILLGSIAKAGIFFLLVVGVYDLQRWVRTKIDNHDLNYNDRIEATWLHFWMVLAVTIVCAGVAVIWAMIRPNPTALAWLAVGTFIAHAIRVFHPRSDLMEIEAMVFGANLLNAILLWQAHDWLARIGGLFILLGILCLFGGILETYEVGLWLQRRRQAHYEAAMKSS